MPRPKPGAKKLQHHGDTIRKGGKKPHPLYFVWDQMKRRCQNPKHPCYARYGARGIKVCERWMTYLNFKEDVLALGWERGLIMDRIDNDGDYTPENVRFVTMAVSNRNRSNVAMNMKKADAARKLFSAGQSNKQVAEQLGVTVNVIKQIRAGVSWQREAGDK
jgi:hypothetical protein